LMHRLLLPHADHAAFSRNAPKSVILSALPPFRKSELVPFVVLKKQALVSSTLPIPLSLLFSCPDRKGRSRSRRIFRNRDPLSFGRFLTPIPFPFPPREQPDSTTGSPSGSTFGPSSVWTRIRSSRKLWLLGVGSLMHPTFTFSMRRLVYFCPPAAPAFSPTPPRSGSRSLYGSYPLA